MRRVACSPVRLIALCLFLAAGETMKAQDNPCNNVQLLSSEPMSRLGPSVQVKLRHAVQPLIQTILDDPAMGSTDKKMKLRLDAMPLRPRFGESELYIVSWEGDNSLGVNAFNWIVELTPQGGRNLLSAHAAKVSSGFGAEVLSTTTDQYPAIMIASKGYKEGGGAEAEEGCFREAGGLYEVTGCSVTCHDELNNR